MNDAEHMAMYYRQDREHDRLLRGLSVVEFARTCELLTRSLPPAPASVLDVGGGTGVYARWLGTQGYTVHLLDAMPEHVARVLAAEQDHPGRVASAQVGDARALPYPDSEAGAVLLLGPLYHLTVREDRLAALREAWRCLKPGGVLLAAGIPHTAGIMGDLGLGRGLNPGSYSEPLRLEAYLTGQWRNPENQAGHFTSTYFHRPAELLAEVQDAGFPQAELYAIEGPVTLLRTLEEVWADAGQRETVLNLIRLLEREESLLGVSPHLLAIGTKMTA
jgi:SAM-dependent methyltransferase